MTTERLGSLAPTDLVEARTQLHWAAQLAAVVGNNLLTALPDDSHSNLEWLADQGALASAISEGEPALRSALSIADLTLMLLDDAGSDLDAFPLNGHTLTQGLDWLNGTITRLLGRAPDSPLVLREYDGMPSHPVGSGNGPISISDDALSELARWYATADHKLRAIATGRANAAPVRCWPHHFDLATLLTLEGEGESARTVGIGMSPGDGSYAEPYWYVNAWPFPKGTELPELAAGRWHTEGWDGAVLTGSELVAAGDAAAQSAHLDAFHESAIAASHALLEKG